MDLPSCLSSSVAISLGGRDVIQSIVGVQHDCNTRSTVHYYLVALEPTYIRIHNHHYDWPSCVQIFSNHQAISGPATHNGLHDRPLAAHQRDTTWGATTRNAQVCKIK